MTRKRLTLALEWIRQLNQAMPWPPVRRLLRDVEITLEAEIRRTPRKSQRPNQFERLQKLQRQRHRPVRYR